MEIRIETSSNTDLYISPPKFPDRTKYLTTKIIERAPCVVPGTDE